MSLRPDTADPDVGYRPALGDPVLTPYVALVHRWVPSEWPTIVRIEEHGPTGYWKVQLAMFDTKPWCWIWREPEEDDASRGVWRWDRYCEPPAVRTTYKVVRVTTGFPGQRSRKAPGRGMASDAAYTERLNARKED